MTLTAEAIHTLDEIAVRFSPGGIPLAVRYDGAIWAVDPDADAVHWLGNEGWRDRGDAAAAGSEDPAPVEHWRLQARLNSGSALRTFHVQRKLRSTRWLLTGISDAS